MSWSLGFDTRWNRDIGYGVPAYCDAPSCRAKIDRGLGCVCGDGPYGGETGCGLYFCGKHGGGRRCKRCRSYRPPYRRLSPEHPTWLRFKLKDKSWRQWRLAHREEVAAMKSALRPPHGAPQ